MTAPPSLPLLTYLPEPGSAAWLRETLTTFAQSVASFVPETFEAYVRVYHPFQFIHGTASWREVTAAAGVQIDDPAAAEQFALYGVGDAQPRGGTLPIELVDPLVEHLRRATTTPGSCVFALWEGHGGSLVPIELTPTLELPHRAYHLFGGPIEGARTSFTRTLFWQSANLWWPADHAWCVATDVDWYWTYIGGARSCIEAILADPRLEAVETTAQARW